MLVVQTVRPTTSVIFVSFSYDNAQFGPLEGRVSFYLEEKTFTVDAIYLSLEQLEALSSLGATLEAGLIPKINQEFTGLV